VSAPATFAFDFAHPEDYLRAETGPKDIEWVPVRKAPPGPGALDGLAARVAEHGLQPLRAPEPFPFDSTKAVQAALYAKSIGRCVAFSLAAFRQCYAAGRSLEDVDTILIAAAACEMHPRAVLKALERADKHAP